MSLPCENANGWRRRRLDEAKRPYTVSSMSNVGTPRKSVKPEPPAPLIRQGSLGERVYLELRERLQRCEIGPDQRLVDVEIAATYGVSRMPARVALLRLANEG